MVVVTVYEYAFNSLAFFTWLMSSKDELIGVEFTATSDPLEKASAAVSTRTFCDGVT